MTRRLSAACKLIDGLESERRRWTEDLKTCSKTRTDLVGSCLIGSAFLCYAGPYTFEFRNRMVRLHTCYLDQQKQLSIYAATGLADVDGAWNVCFSLQVYDHWTQEVACSGVPIAEPFKVETLLTSDAEIARWNEEGLPFNDMSVQNGILTTMSSRWPLCIDPQMQVHAHCPESRYFT